MLWLEREVVAALTGSPNGAVRSSVEAFVEGTLRDWPEHLRLGVAGVSVLLGCYVGALRCTGRLRGDDRDGFARLVERWESSPVGLVRAYVRAIRSLVIVAEHELATGAPR
jgi:hypothetical protein